MADPVDWWPSHAEIAANLRLWHTARDMLAFLRRLESINEPLPMGLRDEVRALIAKVTGEANHAND